MKLTEHEAEVLEMMNGERPFKWGSWVGACLEFLQGAGYCSRGPSYQITDAGLAALKQFRLKQSELSALDQRQNA